ncbi:hypothetical protein Q2K19_32080 [Micromonospora soli]|uniref:hypothetical protein n=1 Tax=Micromonospora sp. NBRC 110009 TaxID=3061627 RepID=UPI002673155D|nr:hypothetical protein [Micromonospora sp. NBRC 110009]WKT98724.1 hypothetical protein Q2K19_32080 [Micromonospora sp. NBRC 110009]
MSEALVEAGAILPGGEAQAGRDVVTARRYSHPALTGRTVVRLAGATLGEAEDLSMEFLGFSRTAEPTGVGTARRQSLGFPAWALINDPGNGRHALAMVKDMARLARTAVSKPGNAREGYQQLATRLGAAAPHFLPTFWEQAGRAFLAADNPRMAGGCFAEARRAEQMHGLAVDEERLREVHLEFAFAGALTAKMLTEYSRAVAARRPALEAYELVRTLAIRRVAGGLPPYAGMAEDLRRLAKAAGVDVEEQAEAVIRQLLAFPAMARSSEPVWKAYRKPLMRLARRDPAVRTRLVEMFPEPPGWSADVTDFWLELLTATGTLDLLRDEAATVSAARWLERLMALRERRSRRRCERLIRVMADLVPRLRAEGRPVRLWSDFAHRADLDVLDVCLAGGVPVAVETDSSAFNVSAWVQDDGPGRRDLRAVATDPGCRVLLARGAADALSGLHSRHGSGPLPAQLVTETLGAAGLREVLSELLVERAARVPEGTLIGLDEALSQLAAVWSPAGVALAPEAFAALATVDVPAVLARSLRAGLVAELSWPAYEQVAEDKLGRRFGDGWPQLVVQDNRTAHVVDVNAPTSEHLFRYPPSDSPHARNSYADTTCRLVDGQLRVTWYSTSGRLVGYWSADPDVLVEHDQPTDHALWGRRSLPLPLPDGAMTTGGRPWHAGDTRGPAATYPVASDGVSFWRCERPTDSTAGERRWREYDPATGEGGRYSLPAFFAADLPPDATLLADLCELRPAPAEFASSPLGWRDGLVGWRVARLSDGTQVGEGVDGRRVSWHPTAVRASRNPFHGDALVAGLQLPGTDVVLPVTGRPHHRAELELTVWSADGREPVDRCRTSRYLPPLAWWHALGPRDGRGSARLRRFDAADAARLMAIDDSVTKSTEINAVALAIVTEVLTEVSDPVLRTVVAEKVVRAVRLRRRLEGLPQLLATDRVEETTVETVADDLLRTAWSGLLPAERFTYYSGNAQTRRDVLRQVTAVADLLTAGTVDDVPEASPTWVDALGGLGALAVRAAAPVTDEQERAALTQLLSTLAGTVLSDPAQAVRVLTASWDEAPPEGQRTVQRDGGQVTVLLPERGPTWYAWQGKQWRRTAVQLSPDGRFAPPSGATVEAETVAAGWRGADRIAAFCRLLAEHGPVPWRAERVDDLVQRTGMTRAEAALLLAGLPGIDEWQAKFLTAEQRRVLGVNTTQARAARDALKSLSYGQRIALVDAAMPRDPADLWRRGLDVDSLATAWLALRGARVVISEQLLAAATRILPTTQAADILQTIADPAPGSWLTTDGESHPGDWGRLETTASSGTPFDGNHLYGCMVALLWLAYELPWGVPMRDTLPRALELLRERLRNPRLLIGAGRHEVDEPPQVGPALVPGHAFRDTIVHHLAPARLSGPHDPAVSFISGPVADTLRLVLSPDITAALSTPDGAGGEHRDPRVSTPELVDAVAVHTGLDRDSASYYLQLLALPNPTDVNVRTWNAWKPATLKQAQAALLDSGLVLAGKRERAGRGVFLPGGWLAAKTPNPPMETWKQPLYLFLNGLTLVTRTTPELFRAAWDRVTAGDNPRYLDLQEKA